MLSKEDFIAAWLLLVIVCVVLSLTCLRASLIRLSAIKDDVMRLRQIQVPALGNHISASRKRITMKRPPKPEEIAVR